MVKGLYENCHCPTSGNIARLLEIVIASDSPDFWILLASLLETVTYTGG